ncbi:hypothetical protein ACTXT7_009302 [Hymenolepis weldensis]
MFFSVTLYALNGFVAGAFARMCLSRVPPLLASDWFAQVQLHSTSACWVCVRTCGFTGSTAGERKGEKSIRHLGNACQVNARRRFVCVRSVGQYVRLRSVPQPGHAVYFWRNTFTTVEQHATGSLQHLEIPVVNASRPESLCRCSLNVCRRKLNLDLVSHEMLASTQFLGKSSLLKTEINGLN